MTDMVGIYITFWAKPGKIDDLVAALQAMAPTAAEESGTLVYGFHRVTGELEGVSAYEIYTDAKAQQVHLGSVAVERLMAALPDILGAAPERFDLVPLAGGKGLPF